MTELYNPTLFNTNNHSQQRKLAITKKKPSKTTHVPTACINCKKAHLACDLSRPCKRCTALGKCDTCIDIKHKKRGRPKLAANIDKTNNKQMPVPTPTVPLGSSSNFVSLLPMTAPGLSASSFNMTLNENKKSFTADTLSQPEMMTIFLSMDLCCARVSDESIKFLHLNPNDLDHRSFYDFIHSDSTEKLSRIHRLLLDNSHSTRPRQEPISFTTTASSDLFLTSSPAQLFQIANGSQTLRETLKFKVSGKELLCKFYLGGGFGADLFVPSTLNSLYMVCIVSEVNTVNSAPMNIPSYQTEQQHINSFLDTTNLMSMYNHSLPTDDEAVQLVNRLCAVSPSTPPEEHTLKTGYYSSSESSMDGTFISTPNLNNSKSLDGLLDDTLLLLSSPKNYWGYTL